MSTRDLTPSTTTGPNSIGPIGRWLTADVREKYCGMRIAIHPERGIVAHGPDLEFVHAKVKELNLLDEVVFDSIPGPPPPAPTEEDIIKAALKRVNGAHAMEQPDGSVRLSRIDRTQNGFETVTVTFTFRDGKLSLLLLGDATWGGG